MKHSDAIRILEKMKSSSEDLELDEALRIAIDSVKRIDEIANQNFRAFELNNDVNHPSEFPCRHSVPIIESSSQ